MGEPMKIMTWDDFKGGGDWLGAARSWVQMKKQNGSRVTWGSNEALSPPVSIGELEDVVARAAWIAYQMGRRDGKKEALTAPEPKAAPSPGQKPPQDAFFKVLADGPVRLEKEGEAKGDGTVCQSCGKKYLTTGAHACIR